MILQYPLTAVASAGPDTAAEELSRLTPGQVWLSPVCSQEPEALLPILRSRAVPALFRCTAAPQQLNEGLWDGIFLQQSSLIAARKEILLCRERFDLPVWCFLPLHNGTTPDGSSPEACVAVLQRVGAQVVGFSGAAPEDCTDGILSCKTVCETWLGVDIPDGDWPGLAAAGVAVAVSDAPRALGHPDSYEARFDANSERCRNEQIFHAASPRTFFPLSYTLALLPPVSVYTVYRKWREYRRQTGRIAQIRLNNEKELSFFLENQQEIDCPLCITSRSSALLERAAAEYGGILILRPQCDISAEEAERWVRRYGAVTV